jgi:hypothetical protein
MSNRQPEENESQLNSIAYAVEQIRDRMITKDDAKRFAVKDDLERFAVKDDLERFAVKDDFERFATKDDLERFATKDDLGRFATKDDLQRFATKDDLGRFATKEDLERFATKDDLERFATRDDLERFATRDDLERFATKEDFVSLREQVGFLGGQVEDIRDRMATKDELAKVEARLDEKIGVETTAIRGDLEQVHLRLDGIEKAISSRIGHVEAEMSRMRSVLYLLVKDRPDMLRLLGQSPPTGS